MKRRVFAFLGRILTIPRPFLFSADGADKNTFRFKQETRKPGFFYGFLASPLEAYSKFFVIGGCVEIECEFGQIHSGDGVDRE